jgi:SAM-dependent methyltransferase
MKLILKQPMNPITKLVKSISKKARKKRAIVFRNSFTIDENTKILDLGSETGSHIHSVLQGTRYNPRNVYIADIDSHYVEKGANRYGFVPLIINESESLPFEDGFFDIVFCSSVIEHVTVPKDQVWSLCSGKEFKNISSRRQQVFADEIQRLGKQYFVQTPYRHFIIESHCWLPFIAWMPRRILIPMLSFTNRFWVKKTRPDWYLLNRKQMHSLFNDARIVSEKTFGFTKSILAIKARTI